MKIRRYFLAGVAFVIPAFLTIYFSHIILKYSFKLANFILPFQMFQYSYIEIPFINSIISISLYCIAIFFMFVMVGILTRAPLLSMLFSLANRIVNRAPVVGTMFSAIKKIIEIFFNKGEYDQVVLVEYPKKGQYSLGFVTNKSMHLACRDAENLVAVFVPTAPNPTSGFLLFISPSDLMSTSILPEDALKLIVSAGTAN